MYDVICNGSSNSKPTTITLHDILCDNGLYVLFNNYLQQIHAQEELDFWIEVEIFKRLTSERECVKMAQSIYKRFIDDDSRTEVNIESHVKEDLYLKMNNNLYDTDLYDKAQECVESTLKYSCVRVFVDEILPKELRRKSLQPEQLSSEKTRVSLLQRLTSVTAPNRLIKKYRDIKHKEEKYIKSVTAGRKKKKHTHKDDTKKEENTKDDNTKKEEKTKAHTKKEDKRTRKEDRMSGGYSSSSDTDSGDIASPPWTISKLMPRRSNPVTSLKLSFGTDSGDEKRGCMSDGEHTPRGSPISPRSDPLSRKATITQQVISKQKSASVLFGFMSLSPSEPSPVTKCASSDDFRRGSGLSPLGSPVGSPTPIGSPTLTGLGSPTLNSHMMMGSPLTKNVYCRDPHEEEESKKKLWSSQ